jgi:2-amino-4-hydroxy-6-hydroxymethyldihydropteridine diphosphokinase
MTEPINVVLAFGSNLGDRSSTIHEAVHEIGQLDGVTVLAISSLYETDALKPDGIDLEAPTYLNACALVRTSLEPHPLLVALNHIENEHGRIREQRWGDRTLDIDIISYGALESADDTLTIPHPRAWQRDFVLAPWLELDSEAVLPGRGKVSELLALTANVAKPIRSRA